MIAILAIAYIAIIGTFVWLRLRNTREQPPHDLANGDGSHVKGVGVDHGVGYSHNQEPQ